MKKSDTKKRSIPATGHSTNAAGNSSASGDKSKKADFPAGKSSSNESVAPQKSAAEEQMTLFYTKNSPWSNHYPCKFTVDDVTFNCTEQYFMWRKAVAFGDDVIATTILRTADPQQHKKLGRKVAGFVKDQWDRQSEQHMHDANWAKFTQNPDLRRQLFMTAGTTLVECSPRDCRWGIGLSASNPRALVRSQWRGRNLLGQLLTQLRDKMGQMPEYSAEYAEAVKDLAGKQTAVGANHGEQPSPPSKKHRKT